MVEGAVSEQKGRALLLFCMLVTALAAAVYVPIVRAGSLDVLGGLALPLLMWAPGVAGFIVSIVAFRSIRPLGLGLGKKSIRWVVICLSLPLAYTLVIYPSLAALGLLQLGSKNIVVPFFLLGILETLLFATGEEIGWRGLAAPLFTQRLGFVRGQVALGVVWFVYHLPALFFTGYGKSPHLIFGNAMFLVSMVSLSAFLGWVREASGSMWPCAVFHGVHNLVFLHIFDPIESFSSLTSWLIGEQGILLAIVLLVAGIWGVRAHRLAATVASATPREA